MNQADHIQRVLDNLIWIILALTALAFGTLADNFFTVRNFINILVHASVLGIMVIGQTFTLLSGNFDLSAESTLALTATIAAWLMLPQSLRGLGVEWSPWIVVPLMLLIGGGIGLVNGLLITKVKMNNFIVTLAMLIILRGVVYIWTGGNTYVGLPNSFAFLGGGSIGPLPVSVVAVIVAFVLAHIVVTYRVFGRELYAVGGNREAAFTAGIDVDRTIILAYVVSGTLAAVSGWMLAGRLQSVIPK
ncbi:MAG: ABC transporter permease, partial [Firmicutes bacterium]|nr:ABC transporter permease [Bacillota bacterium]